MVIGNDGTETWPSVFYGAMDEVRIWRVARSYDEIRAAMNTSLDDPEQNLISSWNFARIRVERYAMDFAWAHRGFVPHADVLREVLGNGLACSAVL